MTNSDLFVNPPRNRLVGDLPKIGIRPTIDGRLGGVRESLEAQTMNQARAVAELLTANLRHASGQPVECVIADSTIGRVAESAAKPTPEEVKAYYSGKPALFAQRRIYSLAEFAIEAPADQREALAGKLQGVKSPSDLAAALNAAGIKFASRNVTQAPENLPLPMVDKIAAMGEGQSFTVGTPAGLTLVFVTAAKPAPVTEDAARPAIEQFLLNDRKRKLVADEIKRLREVAKIEYKGQFANAPAGAASGVEAPAVAPTPAASQ